MIEIVTDWHVFQFDGQIIEVYEAGGDSKRFHPALIKAISLEDRGRRGKRLKIDTVRTMALYALEDEHTADIQKLVDAVQKVLD